MSLLKCPKCGEMFSDTYDTCPFCAEDEDLYNGRKPRNPGRKVVKQRGPSIVGPALFFVLLLLAAFLVYTFYGDRITDWLNERKDPTTVQTDPKQNEPEPQTPEVKLELDSTQLTLQAGDSQTLTATGAENVQWTSSDESVATVAQDGKVTAVAAGTTTVTAVSGDQSVACAVTVEAASEPQPQPEPQPEPQPQPQRDLAITAYGSELYKSDGSYDITLGTGESVQLQVRGADGSVSWSSSDSSKVTVSDNGTVTRESSGTVTVTASADGRQVQCIIRG